MPVEQSLFISLQHLASSDLVCSMYVLWGTLMLRLVAVTGMVIREAPLQLL